MLEDEMHKLCGRPYEPPYALILRSATMWASKGETYELLGKLIEFCEQPENLDAEERKREAIGKVMDAITKHHDAVWNGLQRSLHDLKEVPRRERNCPKRYRNGLSRMIDEFAPAMISAGKLTSAIASCQQ